VKCFVSFRLKPSLSHEQYEEWFRTQNVPAVRKLTSISSYRVWRAVGAMEGEPPFDYLEEMELDDRATFDAEVEALPEMAAMLEEWYTRVADQAIVYAVEVPQDHH
jgi:REDY-like protein HapK